MKMSMLNKRVKRFLNIDRLGFKKAFAKWSTSGARQRHNGALKHLHRLGLLFQIRIFPSAGNSAQIRASQSFLNMCKTVRLSKPMGKYFYYSLDTLAACQLDRDKAVIGNVTINYRKFIDCGFVDIDSSIRDCENAGVDSIFAESSRQVLCGIRILNSRIQTAIEKELGVAGTPLSSIFQKFEEYSANSFQEGLQRILFLNQMLWQSGHRHNGLGRLDQLLIRLYEDDIKSGVITEDIASEMIKEFCTHLHRDYEFKSSDLLGDTGQIIVIGGVNSSGKDVCNELTRLFLKVVGEVHQPEPKILFRIGCQTDRKYLEYATHCLSQRTGSPLFSNDEVVIPSLLALGYPLDDARNYGSAACWEPLIPGRSLDQGNNGSLVFPDCLKAAMEAIETLNDEHDLLKLVDLCDHELRKMSIDVVESMNRIIWHPAPFMSLFMDDCLPRSRDISNGGAVYNNYGFTTVGLGNLVDSILNLRHCVLGSKTLTFPEVKTAMSRGSYVDPMKSACLLGQRVRYGCDIPEVVQLTRHFSDVVEDALTGRVNRLGGLYKYGLSSPQYIGQSLNYPATPDGRNTGDPFYVHISSKVFGDSCTELIRFAGKLDYSGSRSNGNVVDFVIEPEMVDSEVDKFCDFLQGSIRCGFFQMQMTVVDSKTILEAMKDPKKFPNLIVRVWGFSAYFKDLPREYQQLFLERTLRGESARW